MGEWVAVRSIKRISEAANEEPKWHMGSFSLRNHIIKWYPKLIQKIFEKCIPVEATASFVTDDIRYIAHSPLFKATPEGSFITEYEVMFKESLSGEIEIAFGEVTDSSAPPPQRRVTFA
jgi:hypothetical protein